MKDKLVTFETAKLAKEKRFDQYCNLGYAENGDIYYHQGGQEPVKNGEGYYEGRHYTGSKFYCTAPTQSLLQKWLRDIHNRHITIFKIVGNPDTKDEIVCWTWKPDTPWENWPTYEEALEAALIHELNLIL